MASGMFARVLVYSVDVLYYLIIADSSLLLSDGAVMAAEVCYEPVLVPLCRCKGGELGLAC